MRRIKNTVETLLSIKLCFHNQYSLKYRDLSIPRDEIINRPLSNYFCLLTHSVSTKKLEKILKENIELLS